MLSSTVYNTHTLSFIHWRLLRRQFVIKEKVLLAVWWQS